MNLTTKSARPHWLLPGCLAAALPVYLPAGGGFRVAAVLAAAGLLALACLPWLVVARRRRLSKPWSARSARSARSRARDGCGPGWGPAWRPRGARPRPRLAWLAARRGLWLVLALGLLSGTGARAGIAARAKRLAWGLPPVSVMSFRARLASDSRITASGLRAYPLQLGSVAAADGAQATAGGPVLLCVRGGLPWPVGSAFLVRAGLSPARVGENALTGPPGLVFADRDQLLVEPPAAGLETLRFSARQDLLGLLARAGGAEAAPLLEALLVGVRDQLDSAVARRFQAAGCAHILALSGQHLGVLTLMLGCLLTPLLGKRVGNYASCLLIAVYVWLVGAGPSVLRAGLMFGLASLAKELDRPQPQYVYLCGAFAISLAAAPDSVHSLSFILSYLAVAGITLYAGGFALWLKRWLPPIVAGATGLGMAAFFATAPLGLVALGSLNPFSIITSTVAGPLTAALLWAGALSTILVAVVPVAADLTAPLCKLLHDVLLAWINLAAALPSLRPATGVGRWALAATIALAGLLLYAGIHAGYYRVRHQSSALWPPARQSAGWQRPATRRPARLQFTQGTGRAPGKHGLCHAEALRPELPG